MMGGKGTSSALRAPSPQRRGEGTTVVTSQNCLKLQTGIDIVPSPSLRWRRCPNGADEVSFQVSATC